MNKITPNCLQNKEIQNLIKQGINIPQEIAEYNKGCYTIVGVTTTVDGQNNVQHLLKCFTKTVDVWRRLNDYEKSPKILCNSKQAFILHDPTKKAAKKPGKLTPAKKKEVDAMMEEGKGENDAALKAMAKKLNVTFESIKEYIQSF